MSVPVTLRGVSKTFPAPGGRTVAVNDVSLEVRPGELFFLLGPSGCGKTTLLRMVAGFMAPTAGSIAFGAREVTRVPPNKRNTGMVFQSYALWPHMTVAQNVAFGLKVRKVHAAERARRVREALDQVRMEGYADRKPNQLSGGQQQRVALARALVVRPEVLLLDEPLSNLDAKLRVELRAQIRQICTSSGLTAIYVTHDQKEALSMADRVAILDSGRVRQVGPPRELYHRPGSRFVAEFLGQTNLLSGEVEGVRGDIVEVRTAAGVLFASVAGGGAVPAPGRRCVVSVRPEAVRVAVPGSGGAPAPSEPASTLEAVFHGSTFLGEMAQHELELPGHTRVLAWEFNPSGDAPPAGAAVRAVIRARDAVLLDGEGA